MAASYTLVLASKNFSSWSLRPWLAMKMAGIPFQEVTIPLYTPETRDRIALHSPSLKLPVLKIEDGGATTTVWDSLAISETLAERHPNAHLWPEDRIARAQARSVVAEMHSGFPDLRKVLPMDIAHRHPTPRIDGQVQDQIARIVALWEANLDRFGGDGGFLFGQFSLADCFYAPVVTRFETYAIALPVAAQAYAQRILALPAMNDWIAEAKAEAKN